MPKRAYVVPLEELGRGDVARVGGKNASLGEMISRLATQGVRVPGGFATTADAYREFLAANDLEARIGAELEQLRRGRRSLAKAGAAIRKLIVSGELPAPLVEGLGRAYRRLGERLGSRRPSVAVRSSATAEDLPDASFAGQQETFLNVRGEQALADACLGCYASLFTDRAISYRENHGFDHLKVALSVGVQRMVRSDRAGAGVMFSIDPETGFPGTVLINASFGLGETVVQGMVDPDEYVVAKGLLGEDGRVPIVSRRLGGKAKKMVYAGTGRSPTKLVATPKRDRARSVLDDGEILELARWAAAIERHYGQPMDIEWAKDGASGELCVVQARPETVQSRRDSGALKSYRLGAHGKELARGQAVGEAIAAGKVIRLSSAAQIERFRDGAVLVTGMTDPDWVPIMKRAAAIVTDHGGRTSHAAIVSRELGLPAVVGTGNATRALARAREATVSCAGGAAGRVYEGIAEYEARDIGLDEIPRTRTQVMLNIADPDAALRWWRLPADGVGLARMEFVIGNHIKLHPLAAARWSAVRDAAARREIESLTRGWRDKKAYFVERLAQGVARIAAAQHPRPVVVRMSDFKTNEYAELIGGRQFEPREPNPMLGWRGASRYYADEYRDGFALECRAIKKARDEMGLANVVVMIPFCRTPEEADRVLETLAANGLVRGERGLQVYVMCEIPSNVVLAEQFAERFDGFSIGSNDLTQLVLGVDRDSDRLAGLFDESHEAVARMVAELIASAHAKGCKVGLCGQAPSDHPGFAAFLVRAGIDSVSVNPDSFVAVKRAVAKSEAASESSS